MLEGPELAQMALTPEEKLILFVVLLAFLAVTMYFELRYFRGKKREVRKVSIRKDEAFNSVMTTRAVVNAMRRQGRDVRSAESMLRSAKSALERGDSNRCIELCEDARDELMRSRPMQVEAPPEDTEPIDLLAEKIVSGKPVAPSGPASDYRGTTLPLDNEPNYLQAKFEIGAARGEIEKAARDGVDVLAARKTLVQAEDEFSEKNYSKALSLALKSKKDLGGDAPGETITLKKERVTVEEVLGSASQVPCAKCGEVVSPDDEFCAGCGEKVVKERFCGSCGKKAKQKDKFCRKCGAKID